MKRRPTWASISDPPTMTSIPPYRTGEGGREEEEKRRRRIGGEEERRRRRGGEEEERREEEKGETVSLSLREY